MTLLLKSKRAGAVPSAIFLVLFFTLLSILGSVYIAIGVGNPVSKVTNSLLANQSFKTDAGTYFVSKALETATGDERALLIKKGPQISGTVTALLSNPVLRSELNQISDIAYKYYTSDAQTNQTINVKPLLQLALIGFESVDPQFSKLKKELDKIKPIKLQPQRSGPKASKVKANFSLGLIILLVLTLLSFGFYLLFAKSLRGALRVPGIALICVGAVLIILKDVADAIVKHQVSTEADSLAREAIPITSHSILAPLLSVGLLELLAGILLVAASYLKSLKRVNVDS